MKHHAERGSVLIYILIAVALFAALSYVVAGMLRSDVGGDISQERASLYADEIMGFGQSLKRGIQTMRISNACEEADISFETAALAGYANGTNTKCQVFHIDGGGVVYTKPLTEYGSGADWVFTGGNIVTSVGTAAPDLVAIIPDIDLAVCNVINDRLGITAVGNDAAIDFTPFQGAFASTETIDFAAGKQAGCLDFVNGGNDEYFFYQVLLTR